jgi:nucleoside-diphosphate-sugar epimerase
MRYFVTGATGFIGGELARQLTAAGHQVVALVRTPAKAAALRDLGAELHPGDITDRGSLRAPMKGADGVFHVAAWYKVGVRQRAEGEAEAINVEGTRNVLEVMRELGIPKGVYTSTVAIFSDTRGQLVNETYRFAGTHLSEYDRTKARAHYEVVQPMMQAGLPLVSVLPGIVFGPGDTSSVRTGLIDVLRGKLPVLPSRTAGCWAHVEDTARGHVLAMEKGRVGEDYIIAGEPRTFVEVFTMAARMSNRRPPLAVAPGLFGALSPLAGLIEKVVELPPAYTAEGLRVIAGTTYFGSNAKARRELGFAPRPFEEGWKATVAHELSLLGTEPARRRP